MQKALLASAIFSLTLTACGGGGGSSNDGDVDGGGKNADNTPETFNFTALSSQELSMSVTSGEVEITDIDDGTAISIENGSYSINGESPLSAASTVNDGDSVEVVLNTADNYETQAVATLTVGTYSTAFTTTTRSKDIAPNSFSFDSVSSAELNINVESAAITLAGIDGDTVIFIESGLYKINSGEYTSEAGVVSAGDTVTVLLTTSSDYESTTQATLTVGTHSGMFAVQTRAKDITPVAFSFEATSDADPETNYNSNQVTLNGFDASTAISVAGGHYQINDGGFTPVAGMVNPGDKVRVLVASSAEFETQAQATLSVGDYSASYAVTTRATDITPNTFSFTAVNDGELSSENTSNTVTLQGLLDDAVISVTGGLYSINGGDFTAANGSVANGDVVAIKLTSSSEVSTLTSATVTVGTYSASYSITTRASDVSPDEFSFSSLDNREPGSESTVLRVIEGLLDEADISVVGGSYSINDEEFTAENGTINNGDSVRLKLISSEEFSTLATATLTVGTFSADFNATTRAIDIVPYFNSPAEVSDAELNAVVESSAVTLIDFDRDEVSIIGAQYKINDGEWTDAGDTALNGNDVITLRMNASSSYETQVASTINGNGWTLTFNATTKADVAPTFTLNKELAEDGSSTLKGQEELVFTFSETMQVGTLELAGDMVPDCNDHGGDTTSCLNLAWSEGDTVLTLSPKEDFYWYSDERSLEIAITGDATLGLDENVTATVLPVFETFQAADVVIGQLDFTSTWSGGTASQRVNNPRGIHVFEKNGQTALLVADQVNSRVVMYDQVPTENYAAHDSRFGQETATDDVRGTGASEMDWAYGAAYFDGTIFMADYLNGRVTWVSEDDFSAEGGEVASGVASSLMGKADFGTKADGGCTDASLVRPEGVLVVESAGVARLIVADSSHDRVMIWNDPGDEKGRDADIILGAGLGCDDSRANSVGLAALRGPSGIWSNGEKLIVSSGSDSRLLVWNQFPTNSFETPDFQLGQLNDTNDYYNAGTSINQRGFKSPQLIGGNDYQICVPDEYNNRVLIWSDLPESSEHLADVVIGQSDFEHGEPNDDDQDGISDSRSARTLNRPASCEISMEQLFVGELNGDRVLIYNALNKRPAEI